ncbi:hypothetical protein ACS0TY_024733 [Phlomoides rotata]
MQKTVRCRGCGFEGHNTLTCGRNNVDGGVTSMRRATKLQVRRNEGVSSTLVENLWETNVVDFLDDGDFDQLVSEEQNITTQAVSEVLGTEIPTQESQVHIRTWQEQGPMSFNV